MENASKALIIAGAILLSILLISLGIFVFTQAQDTLGSINLDEQEVLAFNNKFLAYEGNIRGSQLKQLFNLVDSNNASANAEGATEKVIDIEGVTESAIKTGATYSVKMERNDKTALIKKITVSATSSNSST